MSNGVFSTDDLKACVDALGAPLPARPVKVHAAFWSDDGDDDDSYRGVVLELSDGAFALVERSASDMRATARFFEDAESASDVVEGRVEAGMQKLANLEAARLCEWGPSKYDDERRREQMTEAVGTSDVIAALMNGEEPKVAVGVPIQEIASEVLEQHPLVVGVTCDPDIAVAHDKVHMTAVLRLPYGADPEDQVIVQLGQLLQEIVAKVEKRTDARPTFQLNFQAAPELNYPPTGIDTDGEDPWLEVKGAVMRELEPHEGVVALWLEGEDNVAFVYCLLLDSDEVPRLSEIGIRLGMQFKGKEFRWVLVGDVEDVPKDARCFFNPISRQLKAEAEEKGDDVEGKILVPKEKLAPSQRLIDPSILPGRLADRWQPRRPSDPYRTRQQAYKDELLAGVKDVARRKRGLLEAGPTTNCRWCDGVVARSDNEAYTGQCGWCGALLSATTIPTQNPKQPALQLWVNPDGSLWLDVLWPPKAPGRLDTSEVWRYEIGAALRQVFSENPMGMKGPK